MPGSSKVEFRLILGYIRLIKQESPLYKAIDGKISPQVALSK